jgi:predicted small secreted protein
MKRLALFLVLVIMTSFVIIGCNNNNDTTNWLSPMIAIEKDEFEVTLWNSQYNLHRNETSEYVFITDDILDSTEISSDELLAGGALPATIRVEYDGAGQHLVRLVAFAYDFFDHGRPTRLAAHAPEPNPQEILVLWRNPENGQWFNMVQNGIGREETTLGYNHEELVSLRNDNPVYTFLLNNETVNELSEIEVYIIANVAPTREEEYERSGYSILFTLELPDLDNHFHGWEILAACGTMIVVGE